jgi:hypothetical protein
MEKEYIMMEKEKECIIAFSHGEKGTRQDFCIAGIGWL